MALDWLVVHQVWNRSGLPVATAGPVFDSFDDVRENVNSS
jgi:hypothetical protein